MRRFSIDANLLHSSREGKILEDPEEVDEIVDQRRFPHSKRRTR